MRSPHWSKIAPYGFCSDKRERCKTQQVLFTGFHLLLVWHFRCGQFFFLTPVSRNLRPQDKPPSGTWIWVSPSWGEKSTGQQASKGRGVTPLSWAASIPGWKVPFGLEHKARPRWQPSAQDVKADPHWYLFCTFHTALWASRSTCSGGCHPSSRTDIPPDSFWLRVFGHRLTVTLWAALSSSSTLTVWTCHWHRLGSGRKKQWQLRKCQCGWTMPSGLVGKRKSLPAETLYSALPSILFCIFCQFKHTYKYPVCPSLQLFSVTPVLWLKKALFVGWELLQWCRGLYENSNPGWLRMAQCGSPTWPRHRSTWSTAGLQCTLENRPQTPTETTSQTKGWEMWKSNQKEDSSDRRSASWQGGSRAGGSVRA